MFVVGKFGIALEPIDNECPLFRQLYPWTSEVDLATEHFQNKMWSWVKKSPAMDHWHNYWLFKKIIHNMRDISGIMLNSGRHHFVISDVAQVRNNEAGLWDIQGWVNHSQHRGWRIDVDNPAAFLFMGHQNELHKTRAEAIGHKKMSPEDIDWIDDCLFKRNACKVRYQVGILAFRETNSESPTPLALVCLGVSGHRAGEHVRLMPASAGVAIVPRVIAAFLVVGWHTTNMITALEIRESGIRSWDRQCVALTHIAGCHTYGHVVHQGMDSNYSVNVRIADLQGNYAVQEVLFRSIHGSLECAVDIPARFIEGIYYAHDGKNALCSWNQSWEMKVRDERANAKRALLIDRSGLVDFPGYGVLATYSCWEVCSFCTVVSAFSQSFARSYTCCAVVSAFSLSFLLFRCRFCMFAVVSFFSQPFQLFHRRFCFCTAVSVFSQSFLFFRSRFCFSQSFLFFRSRFCFSTLVSVFSQSFLLLRGRFCFCAVVSAFSRSFLLFRNGPGSGGYILHR